jgi:branched-chain amino acid transport system permease protein
VTVQSVASVIVLASLYTLLGVGYVLIYRASRVLNLAQGDLMMFGGYALFAAATTLAAPPVFAAVFALGTSFATGLLIYAALMRKMAGHPAFAAVLVTVSLGILLRVLVVVLYTDQIRHPAEALRMANPPVRLPGGAAISTLDALTVGAAALVLAALFAFLRGSHLGIQMRAAGEHPLLAAQRGINFHAVFALSWALAALTGGIAGMLYASNVRLEPGLGVIGLRAFAVVLVGGLDSLGGVVPAALMVAAAEVLTVRYGNPLLADVSPFVCLLAMLLVRPWGLSGTREELDRV